MYILHITLTERKLTSFSYHPNSPARVPPRTPQPPVSQHYYRGGQTEPVEQFHSKRQERCRQSDGRENPAKSLALEESEQASQTERS